MIMIIAMFYIFFILCDISSTFKNYFQRILSPPPEKIHSLLFSHFRPKNSKSASHPLFTNISTLKVFQQPPLPIPLAERGETLWFHVKFKQISLKQIYK